MWGSWDDPRARATRGLRRPSLDARSWDHPSHPLVKGGKGSLAAVLLGKRRVSARRGWAGEKSGLFEHPAGVFSRCAARLSSSQAYVQTVEAPPFSSGSAPGD
jgi:hypothetical protein